MNRRIAINTYTYTSIKMNRRIAINTYTYTWIKMNRRIAINTRPLSRLREDCEYRSPPTSIMPCCPLAHAHGVRRCSLSPEKRACTEGCGLTTEKSLNNPFRMSAKNIVSCIRLAHYPSRIRSYEKYNTRFDPTVPQRLWKFPVVRPHPSVVAWNGGPVCACLVCLSRLTAMPEWCMRAWCMRAWCMRAWCD